MPERIETSLTEWKRIVDIKNDHPLAADLIRLGFLPDQKIQIACKAPWGEPFMVSLNNSWFILRRQELDLLHLESCPA